MGDLLDFSRERPLRLEPTPLRALVDEALSVLPAHAVEIRNQVDEQLPAPQLDRAQFRQVLINLLQNAIEALAPEREGGWVAVRGAVAADGALQRVIEDTGEGMSEEVAAKNSSPSLSGPTTFQCCQASRPCGLCAGITDAVWKVQHCFPRSACLHVKHVLHVFVVSTARNITLTLDEETLREARVLAAQQGLSVSAFLRRELATLVERQRGYTKARGAAVRRMQRGQSLGGAKLASREELHDRAKLR